MRIEIIGNIASGKTSLARLLNGDWNSHFEDFKSNPFWEPFYRDPDKFNFETEVTFTLQHYHDIKKNSTEGNVHIFDFSLYLDQAYADLNLSGDRYRLYSDLLKSLLGEIRPPDILINIVCDEGTSLSRIKSRGRTIESSISIDYLAGLSDAIKKNIDYLKDKPNVIYIDSDVLDFVNDDLDKKKAINKVRDTVGLLRGE